MISRIFNPKFRIFKNFLNLTQQVLLVYLLLFFLSDWLKTWAELGGKL